MNDRDTKSIPPFFFFNMNLPWEKLICHRDTFLDFWPLLWCQDNMIQLKCFSFSKPPVFKIHTGIQGKNHCDTGKLFSIFQFVNMQVPWPKNNTHTRTQYKVCPWLGKPQNSIDDEKCLYIYSWTKLKSTICMIWHFHPNIILPYHW